MRGGLVGYQSNAKEVMDGTGAPSSYPLKDRLAKELTELKFRSAEIEEALQLLEKNPDTERLLTLLGRF